MPLAAFTDTSAQGVSRSECISALSFALDLTEGAAEGHALRSCLFGMRLADELDLTRELRHALYYALLLKDIGCSSNAGRMCQIFGGDERVAKARFKLTDWTASPTSRQMLHFAWSSVAPGSSVLRRGLHMLRLGAASANNIEEMIALRCDRGGAILGKLGMDPLGISAVQALDEHWNGSGYPHGLRGTEIPLLARICAVAQHLDVFTSRHGASFAMHALIGRSGTWYDPALVRAAQRLHRRSVLWTDALPSTAIDRTRAAVLDLDLNESLRLSSDQIDTLCAAFADTVDAKSSFTFQHSVSTAQVAGAIAADLGLSQPRLQLVSRAALLHDIGKLGVPNSILDKPGQLTSAEFALVQRHPLLTERILERVAAFAEMARLAGQHHEKLDGSGYPHRLHAGDLSIEARIIAIADIYTALAEDRPYRPPFSPDQTLAILAREVPHKLDKDCFDALSAIIQQGRLPGIVHTAAGHAPAGTPTAPFPQRLVSGFLG